MWKLAFGVLLFLLVEGCTFSPNADGGPPKQRAQVMLFLDKTKAEEFSAVVPMFAEEMQRRASYGVRGLPKY